MTLILKLYLCDILIHQWIFGNFGELFLSMLCITKYKQLSKPAFWSINLGWHLEHPNRYMFHLFQKWEWKPLPMFQNLVSIKRCPTKPLTHIKWSPLPNHITSNFYPCCGFSWNISKYICWMISNEIYLIWFLSTHNPNELVLEWLEIICTCAC